MVSMFPAFPHYSYHDRVNLHGVKKPLSISTPIQQYPNESARFKQSIMSVQRVPPTEVKFFYAIADYDPTKSWQASEHALSMPLVLHKGDLVQLISFVDDTTCFVKLVNKIGEGCVLYSVLKEHRSLNRALTLKRVPKDQDRLLHLNEGPLQTLSYRGRTLMELTPPTSPSTIASDTFSHGTQSRASSVSSTSNSSTSSVNYRIPVLKVQVVNLNTSQSRLSYSLNLVNAEGQKFRRDRYYQEFYSIHTHLLTVCDKPGVKLPLLPLPCVANECSNNETRVNELTSYVSELIETVRNSGSQQMVDTLQQWLVLGDETRMIKIKVLINGDYRVFKCESTAIETLEKLRKVVNYNLHLHIDYNLVTKIDGWYIVSLSNEDVYAEAFTKVKESQRLILEVKV
ncbi:uncharacterized protein KNAG_0F03530 [Huiozyma naganishii CBS 8797]|uniref:PX domain-containing protein n=1 Tax=Huiozyma naganishii (strain ATCC MYA-139 / BCRC 22969 / CBS 8797 / KCTC 17520 / NBRC 10181 / NCYC 3082 / Yp74L-3) TaxID=1071383 RepID=J7R838_HUIN7|nr:hypothetical protein KNAG_0F03530 [Kazachstania naganishii CBS 8797]CCK71015.1 hypothetical protein KNAG_0F03530 [Kazachstania naganishii CBS 8797]